MNMISTGAFLNEMDASNKQPTVAEKFVAVWEKKNTKAARAGGVSLMALSLAACGSSSTTTTSSTDDTSTDTSTDTATTPANFTLTPLVDIASENQALTGSITNDFRFTDGNETVTGITATMASTDTLLDPSTTDSDTLNVTVTGATTITTVNVENINLSYAVASSDFTAANTGATSYNVSGSVAGTLSTPASAATVTLDGYGRVLTIEGLNWTGTTAAGSANSATIALSGATHGTTAATRTGVTFDATGNDNLETLNIQSIGDAANTFTLAVNNSETIGTIATSGAQDLTIRVAEGLIDGKTIDGSASTGAVNVSLDVNGAITTNAANWTGVDAIMLRDSATGANNATINSVKSGQKTVVQNSINNLDISVQGAAYTSLADNIAIDLNGSSTTAGVTVTALGDTTNGQNISTLNLGSLGLASSTSTTAANTVTTLNGDYSTINITGDTSLSVGSLNIDATQTASTTTARAVTVDASDMTGNAFVSITAAANAKVSYNMTGTLGADTLVANGSGSTLAGGAGADTLTGGAGADTITGGAGNDEIDVSAGADTLTGGAGNDTYDINAADVSATAQVSTIEFVDGGTFTAGDTITVTVAGSSATYVVTTADVSNTSIDENVIAENVTNMINSNFSASVTASFSTDTVSLTAVTSADATPAVSFAAVGIAATTEYVFDASATTGVDAADVNSTITDFAAGDIINSVGITALGTGGYYEGAAGSMTAGTDYGVVVLTSTSYASANAAATAVNSQSTSTTDAIVIYLDSTTGYAEGYFDNNIGGNNTAGGDLFAFTGITNLTDLAAIMSSDSFTI